MKRKKEKRRKEREGGCGGGRECLVCGEKKTVTSPTVVSQLPWKTGPCFTTKRATTHSKMEYDVCQGLEIRVGTKGDGWKKGTKGGRRGKGGGGGARSGRPSRSVGGFVVVFPKGRQNNHSTPRRNARGKGENRNRGERKGQKVKGG